MKKRWLPFISILILSIILIGCGETKDNNTKDNEAKETKTTYSVAGDYFAENTKIDGDNIINILKDTPIQNVDKAELFLSEEEGNGDIDCYVSYKKDNKDQIAKFELTKDTSGKYVIDLDSDKIDESKEDLLKDAKKDVAEEDNLKVKSWEDAAVIVNTKYQPNAELVGKEEYKGTMNFNDKRCYLVEMKENNNDKAFKVYVDAETGNLYSDNGEEVK